MRRERALAVFERDHVRRGLSPATLRGRLYTAKRFLRFTDQPVKGVTVRIIREYLAFRSSSGLAANSLALELGHLRAFFRSLNQLGKVKTDPTVGLSVLESDPLPPLVLSRESVIKMLAASSEVQRPQRSKAIALRDRACLELLYGAGLRASEAKAIRVVDLRLDDGTLLVRRAKRGVSRVLPLPKSALPHLESYLREGRPALAAGRGLDQGHLLLTKFGTPLGKLTLGQRVTSIAKRAGVEAHPHAFRRALATHLVQEGVTVEAVRQILGHADLETTARYLAVERSELRTTVALLDQPISP